MRLRREKKRQHLAEFLAEARSRLGQGYSLRQLLNSHIPDIGRGQNVSEKEVTEALRSEGLKKVMLGSGS